MLKVTKVTSTKTQLPYDYYDLPFCKEKGSVTTADNLGERISGDTSTDSPYELYLKFDQVCVILCRQTHSKKDLAFFRQMIDEEYRVHMLLELQPRM